MTKHIYCIADLDFYLKITFKVRGLQYENFHNSCGWGGGGGGRVGTRTPA